MIIYIYNQYMFQIHSTTRSLGLHPLRRMVGQDLEDALGIITDDEEDRKGADRRVILVQDQRGWWDGMAQELQMGSDKDDN